MNNATLYLVAVPIGNDGDMTFRAVDTLKNVDVIAAEDTRKAKRLFQNFDIKPTQVISHHDQNEKASAAGIIAMLQAGKSVALITDAGMPCVSDPGYLLVKEVRDAGLDVEIIPGVSASLTAVAASGLPSRQFTFVGFPPRKSGDQKKLFEKIKNRSETQIFYESPRRVVDTLKNMVNTFGADRAAFIGRELTKIHQEMKQDTLQNLLDDLQGRSEVLGEFVIVVEGGSGEEEQIVDMTDAIQELLEQGMKAKDIRNQLHEQHGWNKKEIYSKVLELNE